MNRISVCLASFNGEKYIKEQLESIIHQLSEDDEIIISDDHSTDDTIKIVKSFEDNRIKDYAYYLEITNLVSEYFFSGNNVDEYKIGVA